MPQTAVNRAALWWALVGMFVLNAGKAVHTRDRGLPDRPRRRSLGAGARAWAHRSRGRAGRVELNALQIGTSTIRSAVIILEILFWASLGAILWTHVGYPLFVAALAAARRMRVAKDDIAPSVAVVVAAHNEEAVIERLVESLLAQDYPGGLEVVVASDASTDGMDALVERLAARDGRVRLVRCPRGGKVAAQNPAVAHSRRARSSPSPTRARSGSRMPSGSSSAASPTRSRLRLRPASPRRAGRHEPRGRSTGATSSGCAGASRPLGSITGGNGAIYAVRRDDYVEVDPRFGHDLTFPYLMVQHGLRAVYDPEARASRPPGPRPRGRVRAQGAHVRALLAHPRSGRDAPRRRAAVCLRALLAPRPSLRERPPARRPPRDQPRPRRRAGSSTSRCSPRRSRCSCSRSPARLRLPIPGAAHRLLLRARHVGHGRGALPLRCASACRPSGRRSRARGEARAVDLAGAASSGSSLASP